jgi:hypothetical protein
MEDHMRTLIDFRIWNFKALLLERLTPLLRAELHEAIKVYSEALEHPVELSMTDLNDLYDRLTNHWNRIYGNFIGTARLLQDITMLQFFLTAKLLEDYANEPYLGNQWTLDRAQYVRDGNDTEAYRTHIVFPLEELMLNRDRVEQKILAAAASERRPGGDIRPLIDRRDWRSLATALTDDRELTTKLFEGPSIDPITLSSFKRDKILRQIDEITEKYFAQLSGAAESVTSKLQNLSEGHGESALTPLIESEVETKKSFPWKIFDIIRGSVRGTSPSHLHSKKSQ